MAHTIRFSISFILLLVFRLNMYSQAPVKNYEKEWKQAEDFIKKGLPQSALAEVKNIYQLAKKDKQEAQVIKSLVYMLGLQQQTRENNEAEAITEMEKEIAAAGEPVASILKNLLAELYWNYFQQQRWKLYSRTQTTNFVKDDIATWAAEDFHKKIGELYLQSISKQQLLQQTRLERFDAIIFKGNVRYLRPTLFDLLSQRALNYFKNDERDINKPAYSFEIDQPQAFLPAAEFVKIIFTTKDSLSLRHKALLIYQQLLLFHLNDAKPDAFVYADIDRIEFVKANSVLQNKDELYLRALENITQKYPGHPAAAQALYLVAEYYEGKAVLYQAGRDTANRLDRVKAKEIAEKILLQKAESEGWVNAYNLLKRINQKELFFQVEKINTPALSFRVLINYRNFNQLFLRIIKADEKLKSQLENQYDEKYWVSLLAATPLRTWQQQLPGTNDLQKHAVEIKADALPVGEYILVASSDPQFNAAKTVAGARMFYVSNISYINSGKDFFVLHRETGQPLTNAAIQVWWQKYNYQTYKYSKEKGEQYKANTNGFFQIKSMQDAQNRTTNYILDITYNNDRLFMNEWMYDYSYFTPDDNASLDEDKRTRIFLFSDRSIYRPAQLVYFKGIAVAPDKSEQRNKIRAGYSTTVYLSNANNQLVDSIKLITNEFGSFSGKFLLPQGVLNGQFSIYTTNRQGAITFRVEEYKRPKFYVEYEKIKGTYKAGDKIKITGTAKAYAGNNIDGALVKYRVIRQPRFIYSWLFWRWWQPPAEPMEIVHGEMRTGKDGKFNIEFTAIPDLKIDRKFDPIFDYKIYADVTDINGETRSGETVVTAGYKSLILNVDIPTSLPVDSLNNIFIKTQNMNGEFEPAIVYVTIYKLKPEDRLIRSRYWQRPDQFVMSREEFLKFFPYDEYKDETDYRSWQKEEKVFEKSDSVKMNGEWLLNNGRFAQGWYQVEVETKDRNGEPVKDVKYIELYDERSDKLSRPQYLWSKAVDKPVEPEQTANIQLGSSSDNLFIVQQVDRQQSDNYRQAPADYSFINLNKEKKNFDFAVSEADRGGYGVAYFFVKHNRFYQFADVIRVPWTNKDLAIEYATFRDKTLPGSEEKWNIKIKGYKNEKVAGEMLASMYDASLDQFVPHNWNKPAIWPGYVNYKSWNGTQNFIAAQSNQKWFGQDEWKHFEKNYDYFNFGSSYTPPFNFLSGRVNGISVHREMRQSLGEVVIVGYGAQRKQDMTGAVANVRIRGSNAPENESAKFDFNMAADLIIKNPQQDPTVQIRKNFNETAFFFPDLRTDSNGNIEFSFTIPEALTRWKFQSLIHTKELAFGLSSKEVITQKQLMVQPNAPRFIREGDRIELSAKIVNLTEKELTGQAELQLFDATTNQPVDGWFQNSFPNQYFTIAAGQSEAVLFPLLVPYQFNKALTWKIVAKAGNFSDGEEAALPVLTNRMLVTETLPLPVRNSGTKNFTFDKLLSSGNSETLTHHALTVEFTSNPVWYAVQALPYLMEYPYDCAEQVWNRYYANSLASKIANSSPRIKAVFEKWAQSADSSALLSNLQKNQELKAILLEETPWVLQAKNEEQQKKNIALLFDMVKMSTELNSAYEKLKQMQSSNGGFVWFKGGPDDRFITQYIASGIGHLKKLNARPATQFDKLKTILQTAIPYLDKKIKEDYDNLVRNKIDLKAQHIGYIQIQYLYMRSFFPEYVIAKESQIAYNFFRKQAQQFWVKQNKYMQGMIALALFRTEDAKTPQSILKSLKETAIYNEEMGMYWKENAGGWFWHQAPGETQSLLIEAFGEIANDVKTVDDLRTWLLKNKQTNNWRTTKATADACYALLLQGTEWLANEPDVDIKLANVSLPVKKNDVQAGTGYFKYTVDGQLIKPEMGKIAVAINSFKGSINQPASSLSWGAAYWQYFEDIDKITTASIPLKLVKKLFVERNTDRGPVLSPINEGDILKIGDKIKVRVELRADRDMEYVHMKDMRAAAMEPVNVLSGYKWQGGLGYYETTRDASTNFFFSYLRKGSYVFEYSLFVTHTGNFSNGIATIQCMYAPEFSSHSEGIRVSVEP